MLTRAVTTVGRRFGQSCYFVELFAYRNGKDEACGVLGLTSAEYITMQHMLTAFGVAIDESRIRTNAAEAAETPRS